MLVWNSYSVGLLMSEETEKPKLEVGQQNFLWEFILC